VIAVAGLEEFRVLGAFLRDAEVRKDPGCHPASMASPRSARCGNRWKWTAYRTRQ
jgi:hypothetical protein